MLQPFKNITIVMKHKTNLGVTDGSHVSETIEGGTASGSTTPKASDLNIDGFRLKGDLRYHPVVLAADGLGVALGGDDTHYAGFPAIVPTGAVIGVLMNSFSKVGIEHTVMVHGIVGMQIKTPIASGVPVYWDETNKKITATKPSEAGKGIYYIGVSLTKGTKDGDFVDVLIGK